MLEPLNVTTKTAGIHIEELESPNSKEELIESAAKFDAEPYATQNGWAPASREGLPSVPERTVGTAPAE